MRRRGLIALAALLVVALGTTLWRALREPELVYMGQPLGALIQRAVGMWDSKYDDALKEAMSTLDPVSKARVEREIVHRVMKALNTKDNRLYTPYGILSARLPPSVAQMLPVWLTRVLLPSAE